MTVSLTDEPAKNMAASLRNGTGVLASIANVLDPPTTPAPTPPAGGGSTTDPAGFTGRTLGDSAVWRQQASFEENFPTLAPRGQFLNIYKMWSAYPTNYVSTDKLGIYDPYNIEVVELDGQKVMQVRVVSGKPNGRASRAAPARRLVGALKATAAPTVNESRCERRLCRRDPAATSCPLAGHRTTPTGRKTASRTTSSSTPTAAPTACAAGSTYRTAVRAAKGRWSSSAT